MKTESLDCFFIVNLWFRAPLIGNFYQSNGLLFCAIFTTSPLSRTLQRIIRTRAIFNEIYFLWWQFSRRWIQFPQIQLRSIVILRQNNWGKIMNMIYLMIPRVYVVDCIDNLLVGWLVGYDKLSCRLPFFFFPPIYFSNLYSHFCGALDEQLIEQQIINAYLRIN